MPRRRDSYQERTEEPLNEFNQIKSIALFSAMPFPPEPL